VLAPHSRWLGLDLRLSSNHASGLGRSGNSERPLYSGLYVLYRRSFSNADRRVPEGNTDNDQTLA
jgi:hypothetical protein